VGGTGTVEEQPLGPLFRRGTLDLVVVLRHLVSRSLLAGPGVDCFGRVPGELLCYPFS
jgi:hypothetical protein